MADAAGRVSLSAQGRSESLAGEVRIAGHPVSKAGEQIETTCFTDVVVWGRQAETTNQYLSKGRKVLVEGRMKPDPATGGPRVWTGQDGNPRATYEITAESVRFIGGRDEVSDVAGGGDSFSGGAAPAQEEDDIPF